MMKRALLLITLLTLVFQPFFPQESEKKNISLEDAIYEALKNNLDLQIEMTNPELSRQNIIMNSSIFIPQLELTGSVQETNSPSTSAIDGAAINTRKSETLTMNLSQRLAIGGTFSISMNNTRSESNSTFTTVNPSLSSRLTFQFNQPLLKNFGNRVTKNQILISTNDYKRNIHQLRQAVIDLVNNVENAYWSLVFAYQSLETRKAALQRAQDLLKQNEIKVRVGTAAPIDILEAKAAVATNESQVISAERTIQTAEENLKKILNVSKENSNLVPTDLPEMEVFQGNLNDLILEALENRPDIERARLDLENYKIRVKYSKNQMLPDLALSAQYWTTGIGGDQLITAGDFFNPIIIGRIQKNIWETMKDTFSNLYKNYNVSLSLNIPLNLANEKAQLAQAKLNLKQALLRLKNTENTIYSEVKEVLKELETNKNLVNANKIALELEEQKLAAEEKKLSVGLSTNFEVLTFQQQYATAETNYISSIIDYRNTLARINRILARTFTTYNIDFNNFTK